jgi:hypothetical protein
MFILYMNPMRGRCEDMEPVARAETAEELQALVKRERCEPWDDVGDKDQLHDTDAAARLSGPFVERVQNYRWRKCFRKGGPLEWYNERFQIQGPFSLERELERARAHHESFMSHIPLAAGLS